ncbi:predicted protein [Naegleria gruberi]|uniref:Predicted protein n=1 Tax=Naegleria gruberi TaxID=5762 RepID=D2V085_NAEGR|nr:uncharacterized protein NAEGRDRAFT_34974 [Naegleria gruberi]EFC49674.1 predicted protein [Naegleria gruberi]|eukprot:XP_002682418.1 predicted protein [Naegleria gruberi strain NEG-M]
MDNYWVSSQYKWIQTQLSKKQQQQASSNQPQTSLQQLDTSDPDAQFSPLEKQLILMSTIKNLKDIGKKVGGHLRVVSTAMVYFKRFYCQNSISDCDPALLGAAALLLASKIEECPLNAKNIHQICLGKETPSSQNYDTKDVTTLFPYPLQQILECELYLMEQLNFNLTVFHSHTSLMTYVKDAELDKSLYQICWNIVNDSFYSEVVLKYPPYLVSLTSIYMTSILKNDEENNINKEKARKWFDQLYVDMKVIGDITEEILNMYSILRRINDTQTEIGRTCSGALEKLQKMRNTFFWGSHN